METLKILDAGLLTTVQDLGRYGYQRYGVSASGVMDNFSARIANILVGNSQEEAVLETTLKGIKVEFLKDTMFSITGAQCDSSLNEEKIELWKSYKAKKGDILKMGICKSGLRNYIAFSGGIDVPVIMNSKSTNLKAKIGGFQGRKLMTNDVLSIGNSTEENILKLKDEYIPKYQKEIEVGVILGQQDNHFTEKGIETFFNEVYTVTQESDRMGIRLSSVSGETIEHKNGGDIISDGITFGAIQVPGSGQPIIMMADRQTTGGYTKIGNVISSDLPKLAQATPGSKIRFKRYSLDEALNSLKSINEIIEKISSYDRFNVEEKDEFVMRKYSVKINGKIFNLEVERIK